MMEPLGILNFIDVFQLMELIIDIEHALEAAAPGAA
jgi:hypothetical protein